MATTSVLCIKLYCYIYVYKFFHAVTSCILGVGLVGVCVGVCSRASHREACGCPVVSSRDTVFVSDNNGAGVGTQHWTCDHLYVLTEQVFVN